jgi:hypothetical protein
LRQHAVAAEALAEAMAAAAASAVEAPAEAITGAAAQVASGAFLVAAMAEVSSSISYLPIDAEESPVLPASS